MPPQQLRLCAGHVICRLKFARFCGGFCRCSDFAWHGRDFVQASSDFMQPRADFAQSRGDFAQPCTDFAQIYGDFTQPRVDFAQVRGDFAQARGDFAQARGDFERCCLQSSCLCTGFYEYQCVFLRRFPSFFSFLSCECPPQSGMRVLVVAYGSCWWRPAPGAERGDRAVQWYPFSRFHTNWSN